MTGTNSVTMVKLNNFPFLVLKTGKINFTEKHSQTSAWTNFPHLALKFFFFLHKRHHID
jgi:hypothetical protein